MDPKAFENFLNQVQKFQKNSEENRPIANKWLTIAKDDLEVSKILMEKGHYASCIYHLQQCFEKLTKGYYILSGRASPEAVFGHRFNLTKLKKEIKEEFLKKSLGLMKSISHNKSKYTNIQIKDDLLDKIDKSEDEIRLGNEKEIRSIFAMITEIEKRLTNPHLINSLEKKVKRRKFRKIMKHLIFRITNFRTSYSDVDEYCSIYNIKNYVLFSITSIKLHILGMVTFVHFNTPRYPQVKKTEVNYFNYEASMGIVKCASSFHNYASSILDNLEKVQHED